MAQLCEILLDRGANVAKILHLLDRFLRTKSGLKHTAYQLGTKIRFAFKNLVRQVLQLVRDETVL